MSSKAFFLCYMSSADCNRSDHTCMTLKFWHQSQMSPFLFHHSLSKDWIMYVSSCDQTMNFNQGGIHCQFIGCEDLFQIRLPGIFKWGKEEGKWKHFRALSAGLPEYLHSNLLGPQILGSISVLLLERLRFWGLQLSDLNWRSCACHSVWASLRWSETLEGDKIRHLMDI